MSRKTATIGVLAALAVILGYVELLIPVTPGIPGVKLGLANIVILSVLYLYDLKISIGISIVRILIVGFLFTNLYSILYSLSGAALSLLVMVLLKHSRHFSIYGVSIAGGVAHNLGQLILAAVVVQTPAILHYFPILLLSGTLTGFLIGHLGALLEKRIALIAFQNREDTYL